MSYAYSIKDNFEAEWLRGKVVSDSLLSEITRDASGRSYWHVHGDPLLSVLDNHDLVCYFVYTLSSWWEIPLIDRIMQID